MAGVGFFGKVPATGDFLFGGLSPRISEGWARIVERWLAALRQGGDDDWESAFLISPVWRFALSADLLGPTSWIGLMAGSIDSFRRPYPFAVLVATRPAALPYPASLTLELRLDRMEQAMLCFVEGQIDKAEFLAALAATGQGLQQDGATSGNQQMLPLLEEDEGGLCLQGGVHGSAYAWMAQRGPLTDALSLWWHPGALGRGREICLSRGFPEAAQAVGFFRNGWGEHGWQAVSPERWETAR